MAHIDQVALKAGPKNVVVVYEDKGRWAFVVVPKSTSSIQGALGEDEQEVQQPN